MKRVLKLWGVILCLLLITGCMNVNMNVKVNDNKSVDLNVKMQINLLEYARTIASIDPDASENLTDEELKKYVDENFNMNDDDFIDDEELKEMESAGYKVTKNFNKEKYIYEIILDKHANHIDDISKSENEQIKDDNTILFIKTSKNTYKPNITDEITNNDSDESSDLNGISSMISSSMMASVSYIFEVSLPNKPISHNATNVSSDGKTLIWTLNGNSSTDIDFEFAFEEKKEETNKEINNNENTTSSTKKSRLDFSKEQLIAIAFIVGGLVTIIIATIAYVVSNKKGA